MVITYPQNWVQIGQGKLPEHLELTILEILSELSCPFLSFSGGLDSTIMLSLMLKVYPCVTAFTIGLSNEHPDIINARKFVSQVAGVAHLVYIPTKLEIEEATLTGDYMGDNAVRLLYKFVSKHTDIIIACDGIDEFACGYFKHQEDPSEQTYYDFINHIHDEQLEPLHKNSKDVRVLLPYLDTRVISLLSQVPIRDKVDSKTRKKIMVKLGEKLVPKFVINRRKYGFCDALRIK